MSALYEHGIGYLADMNAQIEDWMRKKGYSSIDQFRGKLCQKNISDPFAFERART